MNDAAPVPTEQTQIRVLVVDGSKLTRRLIQQVLHSELPEVSVIACGLASEAQEQVRKGGIDLITTALRLPDMDGLELARSVRSIYAHGELPIIVVSGDVQERLEARALGDDVTDYFDKALGMRALAEFIRGYVRPPPNTVGEVLYVEDSRVVALAVRRGLEKNGLIVRHATGVDEALKRLADERNPDYRGARIDIVLTDISLKGDLTGADLLTRIRGELCYSKGRLPVVIMTGDANPANQTALLRAGANDLVSKPVDENLLVTKLLFQLRVARHHAIDGGG